jgi:hypothetical protein
VDDLFIRDAVEQECRIGFCIEPESLIYSEPKKDWSSLFHQKIRHISSSFYYPTEIQIRLLMSQASRTGLYICFLLLAIISLDGRFVIAMAVYWILIFSRTYQWSKLLYPKNIALWAPVMDLILGIYYSSIFIFAKSRTGKW